MRKLLNLISEPLNIEVLYEQTVHFPIQFKNGDGETDRIHIGGYEAKFTVWKNNPNNPLLECVTDGPDSNKIYISSSQNDEILDQITVLSDFLQSSPTNAAIPSDTYLYRLNMISQNGVDNFVLNGNFIVRDSAPDWYEVPESNPNTILINGTTVSIVVNSISLNQKVFSVNGKQGDVILNAEDIGLGEDSSTGFTNILSWFQFIWKCLTGFTFSELSQITDAQLSLVKSFRCNDSGRIRYWKYVSGNISNANGGTVIVTNTGRRLIAYGYDHITPENFGATGDGVTNDALAFQLALDHTVSNNIKKIKLNKAIYKINSRLTLDSYHTSLDGNTLLDFSSSTNGGFLIIASIGSEAGNSYGRKNTFEGNIRIKGSGNANGQRGIEFNSSVVASNANLKSDNVSIFLFEIGILFSNRAYNSLFIKCEIFACGTCIEMPSGLLDYGEKITFVGCVLYNSKLAVKNYNPNGSFHFVSCSFDYNLKQFDIDTGRIFLNSCHIESNTYSTEPIKVSGNGGFCNIQGGWILCTGNNSQSFCNVASGCSVIINGSFVNNLGTAKYLNSGVGRCVVSNTQSYSVSNNPRLIGASENTIINYDFESNSFIDGMITGDTATITNRTQGSNMKMTISTAQSYSGTKSLFLQKSYGGGSTAQCIVFGKIKERGIPVIEFKYRKPNTQTGNIFVSKIFYNITEGVIPIVNRKEVYGSTVLDVSMAESSWATFSSGEPRITAPAWATHVGIEFNFDSFVGSNEGIYIDNFEVNSY